MLRAICGLDLPFVAGNYAEPLYGTDMVLDTSVYRTGYGSRRADITAAAANKRLSPCRNPGNYGQIYWNHTGTVWTLWAMRISDVTPAYAVMYVWRLVTGDGSHDTNYVELRLQADGDFEVTDDAASRGSAASGMSNNTWHSIWVEYTHDVDGSNCNIKVYRDGNSILDLTFAKRGTYIHRVYFSPTAAKGQNPDTQIWYDDVWINDNVAGDITTAPGKTAYAVRLFWPVSGSPTYDEWDGDPEGTNKNENVDDLAYGTGEIDEDTTYNYTATSSEKQTHEMIDCSDAGVDAGDDIHGLMMMACMSPIAAGDDGKFSALLYADSTDQAEIFARTGIEWDWFPFMVVAGDTPAGNGWTQTLVNSMECGCQTNAGVGTTYKCTAVYAYVAADTPGAGPGPAAPSVIQQVVMI